MITNYTCPKCQLKTSISVSTEIHTFGCNKCNSLFSVNTTNGNLVFLKTYTYQPFNQKLAIGSKGIFREETYEVIGYIIKKSEEGIFYWTEYTLQSEKNNFIYLSEAEGHWIILSEIEEDFQIPKSDLSVEYKNITYQKYGPSRATIVGSYGFFDCTIPKNATAIEYIAPPYILSKEFQGSWTIYHGEHISKREIKKAFSLSNSDLPSSSGVGLVQPYFFNLYNTAIIFCITILLILISHKIMNSDRSEEEVLSTNIPYSEYRDKDYVSSSFTLNGSAAPLRIDVSSNVSNSWAYAGVSLINEKTNEETFAEKDIEYYSGYEDGYAWQEGSTAEHFYICGVGPGKYHLNIKTTKNDTDFSTESMYLRAKWEGKSDWNFMFIIWSFVIFFLLILAGRYLFEKTRWSDSWFSPYEQE